MVDINKPVENPALVQAIEALKAQPGAETEAAFRRELAAAHFLVPVTIEPPPPPGGEVVLKADTVVSFPMLDAGGGELYYPAFTDWGELNKNSPHPNQQTVVLTLEDYKGMVASRGEETKGVVINPFGQSLVLPRQMLTGVTQPLATETIQQEEKVMLGDPADYPHAMVQAVTAYLKQHSEVKAAYLQLMVRGGEKSYLMIVDYSNADRKTLFGGIADAAMPYLDGMYLDLIPLDGAFGKSATEGKTPFYTR